MPKHDRPKRVQPAKDFAQVPVVAGEIDEYPIGGRMDRARVNLAVECRCRRTLAGDV